MSLRSSISPAPLLLAAFALLAGAVLPLPGAEPKEKEKEKPKEKEVKPVPPISKVSQMRLLTREEAARRQPVKLRGVVMWQSARDESFVLHDGWAGVLVQLTDDRGRRIWEGAPPVKADTEPGAVIELEGVTDVGGYSPNVLARTFTRVGTGNIPKGRATEVNELFAGMKDSQRVLISGVVQGIHPPGPSSSGVLMLSKMGHVFPVQVEQWDKIHAAELVDAKVRVEGIFAPPANLRAEMLDLRIKIMGRQDIEVLTPPPPDPFSRPKLPLNRLQLFTAKGNEINRKVTSGIVNFCAPGQFFFMQDGNTGVKVQWAGEPPEVGTRVEVAAFVDMSRLVASMSGAVVRPLDRAALPDPPEVTAVEILNPPRRARPQEVANDYDGREVRLRGVLRRVESAAAAATTGEPGVWQLEVESGRRHFPAMLLVPRAGSATLPGNWVEGAEVQLTGVCELNFERKPGQEVPVISTFRLWLRDAADVQVLSTPSWWTATRLTAALISALVVLLLAAAWISALRRAVRRRTEKLEEMMRLHRNSELEYEAALKERQRLAADLHDGLQQMIAGAAFRLEAAVDQLPDISEDASEELTAARRAILHTQSGLRDFLWGLRHVEDGPHDFAGLLRHAVNSMEHLPGARVAVQSSGTPVELSRDVMGNLLLLMQEAVANAFHHGQASEVEVTLDYCSDFLELRIMDNGRGFDVATVPGTKEGHFGLVGMKERMQRLGGTLHLYSTPGSGTCVTVRLPQGRARATIGPAPASPTDTVEEASPAPLLLPRPANG